MTLNIKSNTWLNCLRSDHWNQRYTLCIMSVIGCTCMSANSAIFYHAFEYISSINGGKMSDFTWTSLERSVAKSAYFIGFFLSSIPGSLLADLMGGKSVFGIGCTCSGLGTILTPILTKYGGLGGIVVLRTFIGAAEAVTIPSGLNLLSKWMPPEEKGLFVGIFLTAPELGLVVGYLSSGYLLDKLQWSICFYIWGGICLVFSVVFFFLCYSEPRKHLFLSRIELQFLEENIPHVPEDKISFVLRHCLKSVRVWCAIVSTFGYYWCYFSIVMDLPGYMHRILRLPVVEAGAMIAVPFTLMYVTSLSCCYMADFMLKKRVLRKCTMRKLCACISSVSPAFSILSAYHIGPKKRALTVCLFGLTLVFMSFYYCGHQVNTLRLSPRNLSLFFSVINTFGGIAAFMAPVVHGYIISKNEESGWYIVGWISFAFLISGIVLHLFCFAAERHWWDTQAVVGDFDNRDNVRIRLGSLETGKKKVARQKVDDEENGKSKQRKKVYNGDYGNGETNTIGVLKKETKEQIGTDAVSSKFNEEEDGGTEVKGTLRKETEESGTKEQIGTGAVNSMLNEGNDELIKMKGIQEESDTKEQVVVSNISEEDDEGTEVKGTLEKETEESGTKKQIETGAVNSKFNEEDDELIKIKGIQEKQKEESETKEQWNTDMSSNRKDDERTKIKGILKKEPKEENEENERRVTIVEPMDKGEEEGNENQDDVER